MKRLLISSVFLAAAVGAVASASYAQPPAQDISAWRHGNLAAAQQLVAQAFDRLTAAQQANEFRLGGHAGRAKELLREASVEMKLAAVEANQHG
jgi:opacity protein-like surface antigen